MTSDIKFIVSKIFVKNAYLLTSHPFRINGSLKSTNIELSYGISVEKTLKFDKNMHLFGKIKVTFVDIFYKGLVTTPCRTGDATSAKVR